MSKECRICFEEESDNNKLISPCDCKGTSQYVHLKCLQKWRNMNIYSEANKKCMECRREYVIRKHYKKERFIFDTNLKNLSIVYSLVVPFSILISIYDTNMVLLYILDFGKENPGYLSCNNDNEIYNCRILSLKLLFIDSYFLKMNFYISYFLSVQFLLYIIRFYFKIKKKIIRRIVYYKNSRKLLIFVVMNLFKFYFIYYLFIYLLNTPLIVILFSIFFNLLEWLNYLFLHKLHNETIKKMNNKLNPEYILSFDINPLFNHILEIKHDI